MTSYWADDPQSCVHRVATNAHGRQTLAGEYEIMKNKTHTNNAKNTIRITRLDLILQRLVGTAIRIILRLTGSVRKVSYICWDECKYLLPSSNDAVASQAMKNIWNKRPTFSNKHQDETSILLEFVESFLWHQSVSKRIIIWIKEILLSEDFLKGTRASWQTELEAGEVNECA